MADRSVDISVSLSLRLVHDLRINPLRSRALGSLRTQAERLIAMNEADRVVKVLHQVRENLAAARQTITELDDPQAARKGWVRLLAATQSLLRSV